MMHKKASRILVWLVSAAVVTSLLLAMTPACLSTPIVLAEAPPSIGWSKTFGGSSGDYAYSVQQTSDGGYVMTGYTNSYGVGGSDVWLIKTNASGTVEWDETYGGSDDDCGFSVQQTADGGYVIVGYTNSYGAGLSDVWLVKTDASGNQQWAKTFGGSDDDVGSHVQQTADGGYVVGGSTNDAAGGDILLIKTDASGNQQWAQTLGGTAAGESCSSVQELSGGGYVLTGGTNSYGAEGTDLWLVWTDALGNMTWNVTHGGAGDDVGQSMRRTADGDFLVAGFTDSYGAGGNDAWLIRTDGVGSQKWAKTYGGTGDDRGYSLQLAPDGGFVVAGYTHSYGAGGSDFWLIKTDVSGEQQWAETFGGTGDEYGQSVECTVGGSYALTGGTRSYGAGDYDFWLVKTLTPPEVTTAAAGGVGSTVATLSGVLNDLGTASSVEVSFEWGLTASYGKATPPLSVTDPGEFNFPLEGLTADTTYHFRARAVGDGTVYGDDATFTTAATATTPPEVATAEADGIGSTVATLNGILDGLGTASSVEVSFEWGLTPAYGKATPPLSVTDPGEFNFPLEGLTPDTTYHFRAKAAGDGTAYGDDMPFTTDAATTTPPEVATTPATSVGNTGATLNGNLGALGTASPAEVFFEWGLTARYGNPTTPQAMTGAGDFAFALGGLTPGTTYHFRAKALGDGMVYGDDMTFTTTGTPDTAAPQITGVDASHITASGATINWTTNKPATSRVEYGLTEDYDSSTPVDMELITSHSVVLTGLKAGQTYHYRVISRGASDIEAVSPGFTFKTPADSGGVPVWVWILVGLVVFGAAGVAAFLIRGKLAKG
ncbi:MAG: fibronectin type III domain-containing protein [Dehalococcoidia bacterium]|nr:fibronectin type III domain-containing protein [Dehalococcoidia bacterium]